MAEGIAPGVTRLDLGLPEPLGANAYLVDDGEVTLVDTGLPLSAGRVRDEIGRAGHAVSDIDRVLVTHYDLDHVGGLWRLAPDLSAPVYVGEADLDLLSGRWDPPLVHHKGLFHRGLRGLLPLPASLTLRPVADGDRVGGFEAFHTPGHNPGHTVYVNGGVSAGMLGDLVWEADGRLTIPIWFDSYDMAELRESVRHLAETGPDFEVACTGHGDPIRSGGAAALRALADRLHLESDWLPR